MRILIDNYRNLTAEHCGSGSMRNLVYHYCRIELPEGVIFGLGSGLDCLFFGMPEATPPFMLFGRSITMEQDLAAALGLDYQEAPELDNEQAWQQVRQQVTEGKPTMLSGDIYYLDYRKFKVHFPGHRFVLLGFDDAKREVYIADRTESATQTCSMDALRMSRNPPVGISTANLWGTFNSSRVANSLADACALALQKTTQRMLGADPSQQSWIKRATPSKPDWLAGGIAGIELLGQQLQQWPSDSAAPEYAAYMVSAITKFGTGGALFRNLFREFIEWAQIQRPDLVSGDCVRLAQHSALHWTGLSDTMQQLSDDSRQTALWSAAQQRLADAQRAETELFERLAETVL
jgi:hypothetical protein